MKEPRYYTCPQCEERVDTLQQGFSECSWCGDILHDDCICEHAKICEFNTDDEEE